MYPRGSAGPAVRPLRCAQGRPCGFSSGAGSCRAANKIIRILMGRAAKTRARWKSRNAGRRALRYISLAGTLPNSRAGAGWQLTACVCQPMRRRGFEAESRGPTKQVRATLAPRFFRDALGAEQPPLDSQRPAIQNYPLTGSGSFRLTKGVPTFQAYNTSARTDQCFQF